MGLTSGRRARRAARDTTGTALLVGLLALGTIATTYGGVEFPDGDASFADAVDSYDPVIVNGSPVADVRDEQAALGPPDCPDEPQISDDCYVSLGDGGSITLEFTDNVLAGSGDTDPDLWIFEVGPDVENTFVDVSTDGSTWQSVGFVGGAIAGVDIDAFGFGPDDEFTFVRLTDDTDEGEQGDDSDTVGADIDAVGVNPEPVALAGLRVRCIHEPLWPQPGDDITITAESLDGDLDPRIADDVEIWFEDPDTAAAAETGVDTATFTATDAFTDGSQVSYGCRVRDDGESVFSGWRLTQVGEPDGRPVPVLYNEAASLSVDILLVPDEDDYSGPSDPDWLGDARGVILDLYYDEDVFLSQQRGLNFWLAQDMGRAERVDVLDDEGNPVTNPDGTTKTRCKLTSPEGFDTVYGFADSAGIFHVDNMRDCAGGRRFSAEVSGTRTALHEAGHSPFGLADEYAPDGGYWQADVNPNVYETQDACEAEVGDLGRTASDCRSWNDDSDPAGTWWTSDPGAVTAGFNNDDLMNDNGPPQALDIRRIDWLFDQCARGLEPC